MPWVELSDPTKAERSEAEQFLEKKARFLIDENLGEVVAQSLRALGWNATYVGDVGLAGHDDTDVFAFAAREDRILLTHDTDFLDDRKFPPHRNPGVVVLPGAAGEERELCRALGAMVSIVGRFRAVWYKSKIQISPSGEWTVKQWASVTGLHVATRYRFLSHARALVWEDD